MVESISHNPENPPSPSGVKNVMKFVNGGLSGMAATSIVHPFDVMKMAMQVSGAGGGQKYRSTFHCFLTILKNEGPLGLYKGLGAGLLRQATYTTTRLGVYDYLNDYYKSRFQRNPSVTDSMAMGMVAGALGAFVGTPAEVTLVRMAADGRLPPSDRRNYKNVFNALLRIVREEGVTTLWRGSLPTIGRSVVVNMTQLASYSQFKRYFRDGPLKLEEGIKLHFSASMLSGLLTTISSMPLDMAKTRIQNQKYIDGKPQYRGTVDVLLKVARHEGVIALWKGFIPYYCRLGPHTVLTFLFLEQLNNLYKRYSNT